MAIKGNVLGTCASELGRSSDWDFTRSVVPGGRLDWVRQELTSCPRMNTALARREYLGH
jgi:hypothetical protein